MDRMSRCRAFSSDTKPYVLPSGKGICPLTISSNSLSMYSLRGLRTSDLLGMKLSRPRSRSRILFRAVLSIRTTICKAILNSKKKSFNTFWRMQVYGLNAVRAFGASKSMFTFSTVFYERAWRLGCSTAP